MKILKVGDKTKAACDHCKSFQNATYDLRDVPLSDGSGTVRNVLVGVCDTCGSVISLPHQSTPLVKKVREGQRQPLEGRVPAHIVDILNLASDQLGAGPDFTPGLLKYYLHSLAENEPSAKRLIKYQKSDLFTGKAQKRLSIKGRRVKDDADIVMQISHIGTKTDLLKSVVLQINDEILVNPKPRRIKELRGLVAATS